MVVEHSIRGADNCLSVSPGVPSEAEARLNIVLVGLNSLLQSESLVGRKRQSRRRLELGWEFHVVAHAIVQREGVAHAPRILPEQSQGLIGERVAGTAETLDEIPRHAKPISLHGTEDGEWRSKKVLVAEIIYSAIIHSERRLKREIVEVASELGVVPSQCPGEVVGKLIAFFYALNVGIRLASEISVARNVNRRVGAAGNGRIVEIRQSAPGKLETKFIHLVIAQRPSVLRNTRNVTIRLLRSARVGVLTEGLVLSAHFDAGHGAGTDIATHCQSVAVADVMVDAQRIEAGAFKDREVPLLRSKGLERRW